MLVKIFTISDIHFGNNQNPTERIYKSLSAFFNTYYNKISNVDIIIIPGDVFDRLLSSVSDEFKLVIKWVVELVRFCKNHNIKLRVLEGTHSHDRRQMSTIYEAISEFVEEQGVDFKYIDKVSVEFIKEYDSLSILYIPDDWKPTSKEVIDDVKKVMKENNLDKVDVVVMHGGFTYQLPLELPTLFKPDDILNITDIIAISGHIHKPELYKKILTPGSFERLTFTDESDIKYGYIITLDTDGKKFNIERLENKSSLLFKTISLISIKPDDIVPYINKEIKKLIDYNKKRGLKDDKIYVRLITSDSLNLNLNELIKDYKNIVLSIKKEKQKHDKEELKEKLLKIKEKSRLDFEEVKKYVVDKVSISGDDVSKFIKLLEELKNDNS